MPIDPRKPSKIERLAEDTIFGVLLGVVGGSSCGAAIGIFASLIGRTMNFDSHVGRLDIGLIMVSFVLGAVLGAFVGPLAYLTLCRKIGIEKTLRPATFGTLLGGFVGAVWNPLVAVLTGVAGFVVALSWTAYKNRHAIHSDTSS